MMVFDMGQKRREGILRNDRREQRNGRLTKIYWVTLTIICAVSMSLIPATMWLSISDTTFFLILGSCAVALIILTLVITFMMLGDAQ